MTNTTRARRKSPQETEIDHLLAEEFHCDPVFSERFAAACGLEFDSLRVTDAVPEFSLEAGGYGDLLVKADMDGRRIALLIEDKITAGPAPRQAERYAEHAGQLRRQGWDRVVTVLVAPGSYRGERDGYEASVALEAVMEMLRSPDRRRLDWRRDIIGRALRKKASTGVQNPDAAMHQLHSAYLDWLGEGRSGQVLSLEFPELKADYYDGDSWIDKIRHPDFPDDNVWLRHRLWTSIGNAAGMVDLIVSPASESERARLERAAPDWAVMDSFSEGKGIKLSIRVPEMRQQTGFCETAAAEAFEAMERLTAFFLGLEWE